MATRPLVGRLIVVGAVFAGLCAVDWSVEYKQDRIVAERKAARRRNERLAWYLERTKVEEIGYRGDGRYTIRLAFENVKPDEEMWIMVQDVRIFVHVGTLWREVPVFDPRTETAVPAVKLDEEPLCVSLEFEIPTKDFMELFQGYMHLKIKPFSLVSALSVMTDDLIEKDEDIFIYVSSARRPGRLHTLLH